jgi:hypothetical protein
MQYEHFIVTMKKRLEYKAPICHKNVPDISRMEHYVTLSALLGHCRLKINLSPFQVTLLLPSRGLRY